MATDLGVGDVESVYVDVCPADGDTQATLTVRAPDGTSTGPITATGGTLQPVDGSDDMRQRWTADQPVTYSAPGLWVLHWDVTGTGESAEDFEVYVVSSPVAGGPTWTPGRSRVANYVTHRTLARNPAAIRNSQEAYAYTFDSTTTPTGLVCDRLIADGVAWVSMRVRPMAEAVHDAAAVVASLYAAAAIERTFKSDERSLERANDLEKRMDRMLTDLIAANNAEQGTDDYGLEIAPVWTFPAADPRYDYSRYW